MRTSALLLLLFTTNALADAAFPVTEIPRRVVAEQPCEAAAGLLIGRYMCQIGMDGVWDAPYPCEIVRAAGYDGYLRFAQFGLPCEIVGAVSGAKLDGSLSCRVEDQEPDVIGHEAVFDGKLVAIDGGYRFAAKIDMVKTHALGPDDHRRTRLEHTSMKLSLNVCRRAWPKGFDSDIEKLERSSPR